MTTRRPTSRLRKTLAGALLSLLVAVVGVLLAARFSAFAGHVPDDLGVSAGRLKPPSLTANSVSSQANLYLDHPQRAYASIDPLTLLPGQSPEASMTRLAEEIGKRDGVAITERKPDYLRAEARTRWMGFVDDLEFWFNPARQVIEVRSASRLGRKDFGVNRERIEAIRQAYLQAP